MKHHLRFILISLCVSSAVSWADVSSNEAATWFQRMSVAFAEQNYDGVFVYGHGNNMDTLRIVHRVGETGEQERIIRLDGPRLELFRNGDELTCIHSAEWKGNIKHQIPSGPFARSFVRDIDKLSENYQLQMLEPGRVVGREAVSLAVTPKDDYRYGYRLWLDKETGLLLKSILVDKGKVLERFQFTQLKLGESVPDEALELDPAGDVMVHYPRGVTTDAIEKKSPAWRLSWLPPGFVMRVQGIRREVAAKMRADTLTYTDGMTAFSVFVEKVSVDVNEDVATQVGATVAVARVIQKDSGNHFVTVVGEVPLKTAKKLAASVVPAGTSQSE